MKVNQPENLPVVNRQHNDDVTMYYLCSNIRFDVGNDFEYQIPADLNEVKAWFDEFDIEIADTDVVTAYIRTRLMYYHELKYDNRRLIATGIEEADERHAQQALDKELIERLIHFDTANIIADVADATYTAYRTVKVKLQIPDFIAAISYKVCCEYAPLEKQAEAVNQELFEAMLMHLQLQIDVEYI